MFVKTTKMFYLTLLCVKGLLNNLLSLYSGMTANASTTFWLSGSDLGDVGEYVWMTSGQTATFTEWFSVHLWSIESSEPDHDIVDGEEEHCLAMKEGEARAYQWIDDLCSAERFYVCDSEN